MLCNQTKNYHDPDKNFNYVERRRICIKCGYRQMTVEIPQEMFAKKDQDESRKSEVNEDDSSYC